MCIQQLQNVRYRVACVSQKPQNKANYLEGDLFITLYLKILPHGWSDSSCGQCMVIGPFRMLDFLVRFFFAPIRIIESRRFCCGLTTRTKLN